MDNPLRAALEALPLRDGIIVALRAVRRAAPSFTAHHDPAPFDAAIEAVEAWLAGGDGAELWGHYKTLRYVARHLRYAANVISPAGDRITHDWTFDAASAAAGAVSDLCNVAARAAAGESLNIEDPTIADVVRGAHAALTFLRPMEGKHARDNGPDSLYAAAQLERDWQWADLRAHGLA